jgi:hypothetical protein
MKRTYKYRLPLIAASIVAVIALIASIHLQPALAERADTASSAPRYDVGETDGSNLIVTDNKSNTLHFYTIDRDKEIGAPLKLRGTIDLNQVGKESIQPKEAK